MKKLLALVLALTMLMSMAMVGTTFAADGVVNLEAAEAVCTGKALGKNNTAYNERNDQITNIGPDSTITYTVPEGISGRYDIYLEVGKANMAYGCTPFYVSINGDGYSTPIIHYASRSPATLNDYGVFVLRSDVELKAGDEITVIGQLGFEFGTFMSMMPPIRDVVLYPAGTVVAQGYNNEIPVEEEVDPSDPLSGLNLVWLGSSVTYGQNGGGYSMADYIADMHPATNSYKYAISGTTLVEETASSYVTRMRYIDKDMDIDYFIVQLSTNDATNNKPLGELSDSFDMNDFDTATIYGAMEYIIAYAQETWGCPVLFYSGSYYESEAYGNMVQALLNVQEKWGIDIIDLWNNEEMTAIYGTDLYNSYMADTIHPNKTGYVEWWGPEFEKVLTDVVVGEDHYVTVDSVTAGYGDIIELDVDLKNNEAGFSSYRVLLDCELDLDIAEIISEYELEFNEVEGGWLILAYTEDGSLVTGDTTLFTITVDMTGVVYPDGEYALDLSVVDGTTVDDEKVTFYAFDGVLTIENDYPAGDVTLDCEVTNADVVAIARYLVELVEFNETQLINADVNEDGKISNTDLIFVVRSIVE